MNLKELLLQKDPTLTPAQLEEAERNLYRFFEILYRIRRHNNTSF